MDRALQIEHAVHNNALWCDAVCRAHGLAGELREHLWIQHRPGPRFYPNIVTLVREAAPEQREAIHDLVAAGLLAGFAVKDSYAALDLAQLGFWLLFEASWIWRDAGRPHAAGADPDLRWAAVADPAELAAWEAAWDGSASDSLAQQPARVFPPALLADRDIRFIVATRRQQIVAGAVAYRTGPVVGLSNLFVTDGDLRAGWAGCVAAAIEAFPGLALVGYERGVDLAIAEQLGFEAIGPLRVWAYPSPGQ